MRRTFQIWAKVSQIRLVAVLSLAWLCLFSQAALALNLPALESGKIDVSYIDRGAGQLKEIRAIAIIKATPEKVWKVITDYGNYQDFMPKVTRSNIEKRTGNHVVAYAMLSLPWPFQNTWYVNRYVEDRERLIMSWSMIKGSIRDNGGSWELRAYGQGHTLATYLLKVDPGVQMIPNWMVEMATESTVPAIIQAVREKARKP